MKILSIILLGVLLGIGELFSPGMLFVLVLIGLAGVLIYKSGRWEQEKRFLITIFIIAILLRLILAFLVYLGVMNLGIGTDLFGDAKGYNFTGTYIAEVLSNRKLLPDSAFGSARIGRDFFWRRYRGVLPPAVGTYQVGGFGYLYGLFYALFGYAPLTIKFLNAFLGVSVGFLIYYFIRDFIFYKAAKWGLILYLFFPSLLLWSITGLKDMSCMFLIVTILFLSKSIIKKYELFGFLILMLSIFLTGSRLWIALSVLLIPLIIKDRSFLRLLTAACLISVSIYLLFAMKTAFIIPFKLSLLLSVFALPKRTIKLLSWVLMPVLLVVLLANFIFYDFNLATKTPNIFSKYMNQAMHMHLASYPVGGSSYKIYPERFYLQEVSALRNPFADLKVTELVFSYITGLSYFLFGPFPWSITSKMQLMSLFQMILWYFLIPFIALGMLLLVRYRFKESVLLLSYLIIIASASSLAEWNIGTLFRHRDLLTPFFIMIAGIGLFQAFGKDAIPITFSKDSRI